jgi:hypothetical protein
MNVKQLRRALSKMPPDAIVIVASDAEQNDFHPLSEVDLGYWDENEGFGDFHDQASADDPEFSWAPTASTVPAVCLTPQD